jgi:hypothetical protein
VFARADLDLRESRLLAAIGFEMKHSMDRLEKDLREEVPPREGGSSEGD